MINDKDVILLALQKERDELHERIMQVDRIMKRIRGLNYENNDSSFDLNTGTIVKPIQQGTTHDKPFPKTADIKIQVLSVFDILHKAAALAEIQQEFTKLSGSTFKIREAVRSLNATGILKMMKYRNAARGFFWIKSEWLVNGELGDQYKPLGFDLLYSKENLTYL